MPCLSVKVTCLAKILFLKLKKKTGSYELRKLFFYCTNRQPRHKVSLATASPTPSPFNIGMPEFSHYSLMAEIPNQYGSSSNSALFMIQLPRVNFSRHYHKYKHCSVSYVRNLITCVMKIGYNDDTIVSETI